LTDEDPSHSNSSIVAIQPDGSGTPFFCIHAIDGEVLRFAPLARHLGNKQPFYGVRAQGLDPGTDPIETIPEMAARYIDDMRRVWSGPYRIGGFSFGGTLALEVASQLVEAGEAVDRVVIFDTPQYRLPRRWSRELGGLHGDLLAYLRYGRRSRFLIEEVRGLWRVLAWLTGARRMRPHLQEAEMLLEGIADLSSPHHRVAQASMRAASEFVPRPYPGRVTVFRARVRPLLDSHDPSLGWDQLALGGVTVYPLTATHAAIFAEPHVQELAAALRDSLSD
jgi:thioesterase domain-containing protein